MTQSVLIVGAGVLGVTLAWRLSRRAKVKITLIDQADAGSGASLHSFAWINTAFTSSLEYTRLRSEALGYWKQLDQDTAGRLKINWSGAISWQQDPALTAAFIQEQQQFGFNVRALSAQQLGKLEPNLKHCPELAAFAAEEGAVNLAHVLQQLLQEAIAGGVEYYPQQQVKSLIHQQHAIVGVRTQQKAFYADHTVLTAGVGNRDLLSDLNIALNLNASPAILLKMSYQSEYPLLRHIISTPDMEIRQFGKGQIWAAEDYIDDQEQHHPKYIAEQALQTVRAHLKQSHGLCLNDVGVGYRPMPQDEMPMIGAVPDNAGLYLINTHAAVIMAPLLTHLACEEILERQPQIKLAAYRLQRFTQSSAVL